LLKTFGKPPCGKWAATKALSFIQLSTPRIFFLSVPKNFLAGMPSLE
jgi:hypothetical protein